MNVYDTGRMADALAPLGYCLADAPEGADIVVLNGDPGVDLENVRGPDQVYVRGHLAHSAAGGYAQGVGPVLEPIALKRNS